jgi:hypothetical protein
MLVAAPTPGAPLAEGMTMDVAKFRLICATPTIIDKALHKDHQEVPMVVGNFDDGSTWVWYVNKENTTATFVVHKSAEQACIIFAGTSEEAEAVVPNANPDWPVKVEDEVTEQEWNT